ncbi:MAG: hypothetical protein COU47_02420 [Candidatus Niyogibacteria bacterium CG10_big_fil_rev_8_21_14_0_10_46_36]|uniref:Uncharacterized protein n=1 Tax=Candidatus Niyogibacteria bacterium CG10_big_fil_rev_8_21_14_0_10_46_36 TaxID=1974726 RepID=A0A2H0TDH6_9BACT|nr:MAG: hypothetical protein COU47_02420 [Candidatus Niyogibacteria bacterium CG10_big_fil_rev_8_21_14_0_10_46_36]
MAEENTIEQARSLALQERRAEQKKEQEKKREVQKIMRQINAIKDSLPPKINLTESISMVGFALISDIVDWLVIGSIPILGDILDIVTWMIVGFWMWWRKLKRAPGSIEAGIIELIPVADILPTWTAIVVLSILYNNHKRAQAAGEIKKLHALQKQAQAIAAS